MASIYRSDLFKAQVYQRSTGFVVVTFDFFSPRRAGFASNMGGSLYEKYDLSQIHVSTVSNNWFLAGETSALMDAVSRAARDFDHAVTNGSSMGGYAAILFSGAVSARRIIAISPQYSLDPGKVPFETRWKKYSTAIDFGHDRPAELANPHAEATIIYDPRHASDSLHVEKLRAHFPAWSYVPLPFGGHPAMAVCREAGTISDITIGLIKGTMDRREVIGRHKMVRRDSSQYWANLAEHSEKRPELALYALNRAGKANCDAPFLFRLGTLAVAAGHLDRGVALLQRAVEQTKKPRPRWDRVLKRARRRLRRERRWPWSGWGT